MDGGGLATELGVADCDGVGTGGGAAQEGEV